LQAVTHGSPEDGLTQVGTHELSTDPGYYSQSPSQLQYNRPVNINPSGGSTQHTTPQTPNTPSSIPDIILTGKYLCIVFKKKVKFSEDMQKCLKKTFG
jgi:hypothetical protein